MIIKLDKIHYEFDQYFLTATSKIILNNLAQIMLENPKLEIEINTHTDLRGTDEYNQELATKRSLSVVKYLSSQGIEIYRVSSKIYGESAPVNNCEGDCTETEHLENRRTEFKIIRI